jgi:hypothetical protein
MSRKNNRHYSASKLMVLGFLLVAGVTFAAFFISSSCDNVGSNSNSKANASSSPSPATNTAGSAAANQASPAASQPNANARQAEEGVTASAITGAVRKEGSGEAVTDAVVVLYTADKRGSRPQLVDPESAQFRFEQVPLKPGVTYSLQTKVPGFCGEESFNLTAVNSQQTIHRDIFLKPCQGGPIIVPDTSAKSDPGLASISEGLGQILAPLNTVKVWIKILSTTWILTMVMLLAATLAYVIPLRTKVVNAHKRIDLLFDEKKTRDETGTLNPNKGQPTATFLTLPNEVWQTLNKVLGALERIASKISEIEGQGSEDRGRRREDPPQRSATYTTPTYQTQDRSSAPDADQWYRDLVHGEVRSPTPLFVEINDQTSENDPLYKRRISFDERDHGSFVVFRESEGEGLIFPRPNSTFVADHHRVFGQLEAKNLEQQQPKRVIFEDGYWKLVL